MLQIVLHYFDSDEYETYILTDKADELYIFSKDNMTIQNVGGMCSFADIFNDIDIDSDVDILDDTINEYLEKEKDFIKPWIYEYLKEKIKEKKKI